MRCARRCKAQQKPYYDPAKNCTLNSMPGWRCSKCGSHYRSDAAKVAYNLVSDAAYDVYEGTMKYDVYDNIANRVMQEDYRGLPRCK